MKNAPLHPRQDELVRLVRAHGPMALETLAGRLQVSVQTVRRDVQQLADAGHLARFHGGVRAGSTAENLAYRERAALHAEAKARIARAVAARSAGSVTPSITSVIISCMIRRRWPPGLAL